MIAWEYLFGQITFFKCIEDAHFALTDKEGIVNYLNSLSPQDRADFCARARNSVKELAEIASQLDVP